MSLVNSVLPAVASLTALGTAFGAFLGVAARAFKIDGLDERIAAIEAILPGANCGACGVSGCSAFAQAVVEGTVPSNGCVVGGDPVAKLIADILGSAAQPIERRTAVVKCQGSCDHTVPKYTYIGYPDCTAAYSLSGGTKRCTQACLGLGTCVHACQFNAIRLIDGVAVVDRASCTACGECTKVCPKGIIAMHRYTCDIDVLCSNKNEGKKVREVCNVGCIGCGMCMEACKVRAIKMFEYLAVIDTEVCINCYACVQKCPTKSIARLHDSKRLSSE